MTTTPARAVEAFTRRAERGTPRGATTVLAASRIAPLADAPLAVGPPRRNRALLAAAAILVVAAIGFGASVALRPGDDTDSQAASGGAFCSALAAPAMGANETGDVIAYLEPGADPADLDRFADEVRSLPGVSSVQTVDQAATYERFQELFADEPAIIETVEPDELPTSIVLDAASADQVADIVAALRSRGDLWEVREGLGPVQVLDLLVWPGADARIWGMGGNVDMGARAYGPDWVDLADEVRRTAPPEVAADVEILLARISQPPSDEVDPNPSEPDGPAFDEAQAAAASLRSYAADTCGLGVDQRFLEPAPEGEEHTTATTQAVGD